MSSPQRKVAAEADNGTLTPLNDSCSSSSQSEDTPNGELPNYISQARSEGSIDGKTSEDPPRFYERPNVRQLVWNALLRTSKKPDTPLSKLEKQLLLDTGVGEYNAAELHLISILRGVLARAGIDEETADLENQEKETLEEEKPELATAHDTPFEESIPTNIPYAKGWRYLVPLVIQLFWSAIGPYSVTKSDCQELKETSKWDVKPWFVQHVQQTIERIHALAKKLHFVLDTEERESVDALGSMEGGNYIDVGQDRVLQLAGVSGEIQNAKSQEVSKLLLDFMDDNGPCRRKIEKASANGCLPPSYTSEIQESGLETGVRAISPRSGTASPQKFHDSAFVLELLWHTLVRQFLSSQSIGTEDDRRFSKMFKKAYLSTEIWNRSAKDLNELRVLTLILGQLHRIAIDGAQAAKERAGENRYEWPLGHSKPCYVNRYWDFCAHVFEEKWLDLPQQLLDALNFYFGRLWRYVTNTMLEGEEPLLEIEVKDAVEFMETFSDGKPWRVDQLPQSWDWWASSQVLIQDVHRAVEAVLRILGP